MTPGLRPEAGTERATLVLAPNANPMTLDGTNTWLLAEPGAAAAIVVDPGPLDEGHLRTVLAAAEERELRIAQILITHGHFDHSEGAPRLAELTGAPVRALDPRFRLGSEGLTGGDVLEVDGLRLDVVATPGHSGDSLCFVLPADRAVLTGDTVLGRGTTVVAHPDGRLADYLDSLHRLRALTASAEVVTVLPGHGPVPADADAVVKFYLAHRDQRLAQVRAALAAGDRTAAEVVDRVYAEVDPAVRFAAEMSVRAQLEYLQAQP
ncbi:MBL fold metallo-hydrolase [Catenulispora yoronensis]|uniref:MBL fold metallo-hydrolase n=2 Tax=Catenulispora yoronensis TaxID=450799 RepID=A0ABP5FMC3_9ACTN